MFHEASLPWRDQNFFLSLIHLFSKRDSGAALLPDCEIYLATLPYLLDFGHLLGQ